MLRAFPYYLFIKEAIHILKVFYIVEHFTNCFQLSLAGTLFE